MKQIDTIRAALEQARDYISSDLASERGAFAGYEGVSQIDEIKSDLANNSAALAKLAELERAAAEPVAYCNGDNLNIGIPLRFQAFTRQQAFASTPLYATPPPAPVAEIREVVVTDEVSMRAWEHMIYRVARAPASIARDWLNAWRAELGPALGLVEIREPSDDECRAIWREAKANEGDGSKVCAGRAMFDACRAVMWPKEGL